MFWYQAPPQRREIPAQQIFVLPDAAALTLVEPVLYFSWGGKDLRVCVRVCAGEKTGVQHTAHMCAGLRRSRLVSVLDVGCVDRL